MNTDHTDAAKLNEGARELLEQLTERLPKRRLTTYQALSEAGESISLLNEICRMLVNRYTEVTPAEKNTLTQLLDMVPADVGDYDYVNNRDRTLASLEVADQPRVETNADLIWFNTKSRELLERFGNRLPPDEFDAIRTLNDVGEQAFMLDLLCANLVKGEILVTPHEQQALAGLLNCFRPVEVADLAYLHNRDNTLASLNIANHP